MKYKAEARAYRQKKSNVLVPWEEYDRIRTECYKAQKECQNQLDIVKKFIKPVLAAQENPETKNIDMCDLMQRIFKGEFKTKVLFSTSPFDVMHEHKMGWYIEFSDYDLRKGRN